MKITSSMKRVIHSSIEEKIKKEKRERERLYEEACENKNVEISNSNEFVAYIKAKNEFKSYLESQAENSDTPLKISYAMKTQLSNEINPMLIVPNSVLVGENVEKTFDGVMVKLEYGEDIKEVKCILKEYGIEI